MWHSVCHGNLASLLFHPFLALLLLLLLELLSFLLERNVVFFFGVVIIIMLGFLAKIESPCFGLLLLIISLEIIVFRLTIEYSRLRDFGP
jgi:hypothetical protein